MSDSRQAEEGRARGRPLCSRDHDLGHSTGETRTQCDEQQGSSGTGLIMEVGDGQGWPGGAEAALRGPEDWTQGICS